jgi:uncharacterized protein (TIGR02284 family)
MDEEKSIEVLNTLIEINNDRIAGYEAAFKQTEEDDLKVMFAKFAATSKKCNEELSVQVIQMGGTATTDTKAMGAVFRAWMSIKTVLTANASKSILNSCEIGEEETEKVYSNVLSNDLDDLSDGQQTIIKAQYAHIKTERDQIKNREDLLVGQRSKS